MSHAAAHHGHGHDDGHHDPQDLKLLGFWIFLVTDVILFSTLFATFVVLRNNTAGGPDGAELFNMTGVIIETFLLLTSSFTSGIAVLAMNAGKLKQMMAWLIITGILGLGFIGLEVSEFIEMVNEGATYTTSAFLSAFFTLVGTHGVHVSIGLGWLIGLLIQLKQRGITDVTRGKITVFSLYWHFLDAVWIFLLTVVYLMGVM
ncbi:cytochrome o ubiquinol oxidase subunit III [Paenibacillus sp. JX-17]|uniref:Cytochrome bo(3) ubiquinol oxidase subunit 3 n=1 Tax=Paenibacillus lacisoli TaxID=3064525 RepID=A0ABT9CF30_9BACL|nr:cytochrome o ubiquinol oxidase subunit III [Paenibacillus sp. JX-17]MDO7907881.1 cytochrome o ubiquinol oxidase subunit III [Paenibacillus sp. JX-17]